METSLGSDSEKRGTGMFRVGSSQDSVIELNARCLFHCVINAHKTLFTNVWYIQWQDWWKSSYLSNANKSTQSEESICPCLKGGHLFFPATLKQPLTPLQPKTRPPTPCFWHICNGFWHICNGFGQQVDNCMSVVNNLNFSCVLFIVNYGLNFQQQQKCKNGKRWLP